MSTPTESILFTSALPGPFTLKGGRYMVGCIGTGFGTVTLQALLPDGTSYSGVPNIAGSVSAYSANGWQTFDLAPGQYKIVIVTATAVKVQASSVPY